MATIEEQFAQRIINLEREIARLKVREAYRLSQSTNNVSNPPTAAQLAGAYAAAATVGDGFPAVLDDNGAGLTAYAIYVVNGAYWYVPLTLAL